MAARGCERWGTATGLAVAGLLAGCALQAPPSREDLQRDSLDHATIPAEWTAGEDAGGTVEDGWLASFGDDRLIASADEALAHNPDLRVLAARVEQAAAMMRIAGSAQYPEAQVVGITNTSWKNGGSIDLRGWQFNVSWELDLWGRVRYGARAAESQFASTEADAAFARQSLVATVAKAWFTATEAALQQAIAADAVAAAGRLLELAELRQRIGADSEVDLVQARANLNELREQARQVDLARRQSLRALELLLGRYPAADVQVAGGLPDGLQPLPLGLPSELLERRPDVIAAERRVASAFDRVGEARAAQLPRLSLSASATQVTSDLFVLQDDDAVNASAGASLFAPLFRGGELKATVDLRTAQQKEAMADYARIALRAFSEVENALAADEVLREREAFLAQAVADHARALELEEARYRIGSRDLRTVARQQLALYEARMTLLRVQRERRVQRVNLHLALGGDFSAPAAIAAR